MGYIGLPTAAMFARSGLQVHGVDVNPKVVESLPAAFLTWSSRTSNRSSAP